LPTGCANMARMARQSETQQKFLDDHVYETELDAIWAASSELLAERGQQPLAPQADPFVEGYWLLRSKTQQRANTSGKIPLPTYSQSHWEVRVRRADAGYEVRVTQFDSDSAMRESRAWHFERQLLRKLDAEAAQRLDTALAPGG